ncbi:unnamed protein product [Timema podura]|uniref:Uncharacterized protein n=1 Tax=Timema podura TaxID=61482 RepID=A0ABN7NNJ6_TIMPD|nr:unnamed protein product [Timema podura]
MYNQNNKRESTVSETTTTTLVGGTSINNDTNGSAAAMFTCGETMNTTTALLTAENAFEPLHETLHSGDHCLGHSRATSGRLRGTY